MSFVDTYVVFLLVVMYVASNLDSIRTMPSLSIFPWGNPHLELLIH